ncbi:MAG: hypothetical protein ABI950_05295 [Solirubrobacteraceae bacterium]
MTFDEDPVLHLAQRARAVSHRGTGLPAGPELPRRDHPVLPTRELPENVTHWSL